METRTMSISFNTDGGGFISQECPACERRFKIQPGKGSPRPVSHCPFCEHSGEGCWFTPEQAEYVGSVAMEEVLGPELETLDHAFQNLGSGGGGIITVTGRIEAPRAVPPPHECDDEMSTTMTFDCCGETIRHDAANAPVYCVICGNHAP